MHATDAADGGEFGRTETASPRRPQDGASSAVVEVCESGEIEFSARRPPNSIKAGRSASERKTRRDDGGEARNDLQQPAGRPAATCRVRSQRAGAMQTTLAGVVYLSGCVMPLASKRRLNSSLTKLEKKLDRFKRARRAAVSSAAFTLFHCA